MPKSGKYKKNKKNNSPKLRIVLMLILVLLASFYVSHDLTTRYFLDNQPIESVTAKKQAENINNLCQNSSAKDQCLGDEFYKIVKKYDFQYATNVLGELQKANPQDGNGCHFMAHRISQAEVEKNPQDWQMVLKEISPSLCTGGFLHGVLEAHMATNSQFVINANSFKIICDSVYRQHETWFAWRGCVHNMGHLMLVQTEGDIEKAVSSCNKLQMPETRYECLSGSFMERVTGENLLAHGLIGKRPDWNEKLTKETEEICTSYSDMPARTCWKVISYLYFATSNHDPKGLYDKCQKAPNKDTRDECFIYGAGNMVNTTKFDQKNLYNVCHQLLPDDPLFVACMNQIIGSLLTSSIENADKTLSLCGKTHAPYKRECFRTIMDTMENNKTQEDILKNTCTSIRKDLADFSCPT